MTRGDGAAVVVDPVPSTSALAPAVLLLLGGVLAALVPVIGVVHSFDGSPMDAWAIAGWTAVLPGVLAVLLSAFRPVAGLAAAAGAGAVGAARFVIDLSVVINPAAVARPELFVETTTRAEPLRAAAGGYVLLVADLIAVAAGVLAALRLSRAVAFPEPDLLAPVIDPDPHGPVVLPEPTRRRNNVMLVTGLVGVLLLFAGSLSNAYTGGFLVERFVPVGGDVSGTLGVVLLGFVGAVAVLCAALLPRELAAPLLGGTALAAAVPALTAIVAVLAGAPTALTGAVWFVLFGAVVLAGSALLARVRVRLTTDPDGWSAAPGRRNLVGGLGGLAAVLAGLAALLPNLYVDGRSEVVAAGGVAQDAGLPIVFAGVAVILAIGAVLTLVLPTALAGRPVLMVAAGGAAFAVARAVAVLNTLVTASRNVAGTDTALYGLVTVHPWTAGPGLWCGVGALLVAAATAVLARLDDRRAADTVLTVADDESVAASRVLRGWIAAVVGGLAVVALAVPVYTTVLGDSATLLVGFALDTWGVWAMLAVLLGGLVYAVVDRRLLVVAAFPAAAAAVAGLRLLVPGVVSAAPGYRTAAGTGLTWALVAALLAAGVAMALLVRRITVAPLEVARPPTGRVKNAQAGTGARPGRGKGKRR